MGRIMPHRGGGLVTKMSFGVSYKHYLPGVIPYFIKIAIRGEVPIGVSK